MSKFDALLSKISEALPVTTQQPNPSNVAQQQKPNPAQQPKPVLNTTQQPQAQLKNPQAIEKIADEIANINDPNKIKQILAQLVQGITNPQTNS